jgi:serine phosphatase RsbU (regulator of sigma subunit)
MQKKNMPSYHGFRIYSISNLLYSFLIIPFLIFLGAKTIPELAAERGYLDGDTKTMVDSLIARSDSVDIYKGESFDSLLTSAISMRVELGDSVAEKGKGPELTIQKPSEKKEDRLNMFKKGGPFSVFFKLLTLLTLAAYVAGLIYNNPFKRYFKKIRRKQKPGEKLKKYCKHQLLNTPVVNAIIITLPSAMVLLYSFFFILLKGQVEMEIEKEIFREFFFLALLATILEFLFVFYWQKHRVHIRYIEYFYSKEELKKKVFKRKGGKIRGRLMIASGMTTTLPLLVVLLYLIQSLTTVRSLNLDTISENAWNILIGPWGEMINAGKDTFSVDKFEWLVYVNAIDTFSMIIGISMGILVSLLYLVLFIRWTTQDITYPVKELLSNIRNMRAGEVEQYTIVRTNDEIGELAEGYNVMAHEIHKHVEHISHMNRNLEHKVKERTQEVVMQKEEIEAQKEEIESQLDLATEQRDTIAWQNEQILDSIRYAERIQSAILPPGESLSKSLSQHFVLYKPRDIVSGDYYWTSIKDGKLLIAVADCTGHGVPGAFLSVMGISSLNEIVSRNKSLSAGKILEELRTYVIRSLHQTGSREEARDGIEIAICVIDLKKLSLEFAGANRPLYLVRQGEVLQYRGDRMPIGIYEQELAPFTNQSIQLQKNDSVYLFSDGYVDQLGGPNRKTFRVVNFRKLLSKIQDKSMEEQKQILLEQHESWRGSVQQIDDILVMGFRL